ncbi:MAG: hypothetical protein ACRC6G_13835, partial [Deefgea sp.]
ETRFDGDSQLSLQAIVNPQGRVKGVVQVLAKQDYQGSQQPSLEWAYIGWNATPELSIKLGRATTSLFLMSDYRNLFYAQTMVRPPPEVYNLNSISNLDGLHAVWQGALPTGALTLEAYAGQTTIKLAAGDADVDYMYGLSAQWNQGPWTVRGSLSANNLSFNSITGLAAAKSIADIPPNYCSNCASEVQANIKFNDISTHLASLGLIYDSGDWLFQSELAYRTADTIIVGDSAAAYAMLGYRINDWTPYVAIAHSKLYSDPLQLKAGPSAGAALKKQLNYLNASNFGRGVGDHTTLTLGVRWDLVKNMALKAQIDHLRYIHPEIGTSGGFASFPTSMLGTPSGFDGRVNVYTLNLDFIF